MFKKKINIILIDFFGSLCSSGVHFPFCYDFIGFFCETNAKRPYFSKKFAKLRDFGEC